MKPHVHASRSRNDREVALVGATDTSTQNPALVCSLVDHDVIPGAVDAAIE